MKVYFSLFVICLALPLAAYQTGPSSRANFGSAQQSTNSANRWNQGVQTKPVQTSLAGSSATEFKAPVVGKRAAQTPKPTKPVAKPTRPSSTTVAMPANADPAAMMQQVQGMMQNMQAITGGAPGAQPPATAGQQGAANIPGMPDMSALMGGTLPAAPAAVPAKK